MSEDDEYFYKHQDYLEQIRESAIEDNRKDVSYSVIGAEIFDYLPIRRDTTENDYINHLWEAFSSLNKDEAEPNPFAVMPFHLLFMLAIQYKILRIYREEKDKYELALTIKNPRNGAEGILAPESPHAIAFLGETEIIDLLKIVGLTKIDARSIKKSIITYRNDKIAHAKGYIEQDIEAKIVEYFDWLEKTQISYLPMNQKVALAWLKKISTGDDIEQFLETHFLDSCFSPRDFGDIIKKLLEAEQFDFDQWMQVVNKGLELAYNQTIIALREIVKDKVDEGRRFNAIRVLRENGEID